MRAVPVTLRPPAALKFRDSPKAEPLHRLPSHPALHLHCDRGGHGFLIGSRIAPRVPWHGDLA